MSDASSQIEVKVEDVWVRRRKIGLRPPRLWRVTLSQASFVARPGKLLAIIGPNGAGKTTLMRVIAGDRPARGSVLLNGEPLYSPGAPEHWLPKIGYVPVDSVLHEHLTVRQALTYIARLRLPHADEAARERLITRWLADLGLEDRQHQSLRTLSSGERKKANIAAELLTDPMLLLLDEPTSNLDPNAERELMQILRALAEGGKTVIVVTHTLSTLKLCHEVVFVANGLAHGPRPPDELLRSLEGAPAPGLDDFERWSNVFDAHPTRDQAGLRLERPPAPSSAPPPRRIPLGATSAPTWLQFRVLLSRQARLLTNTWRLTFFRLLLGFFGGLFLFVLPAESFIRNRGDNIDVNDARTAFFLIGLVVALIGLISSFQEISREWRIYQHERLKGLSAWPYLMSKWVSLNLLVGAVSPIALIWMLVVFQGQPLQPHPQPVPEAGAVTVHGVMASANMPWLASLAGALPLGVRALALQFNLEALVSLMLACVAAVTLGLLLSALAKSDNAATLWLAGAVIFHVFMSGLSNNQDLEWLIERLSVFAASYWAIRGFSVSSSLYCWTLPQFKDFYSLGYLWSIWLALICYIFGALLLTYLALRARDSWAPPAASLRRAALEPAVLRIAAVVIIGVSWSAFLRQRSREYFELQDLDVVARIDSVAGEQVNLFQRANGLVSQAQCPLRPGAGQPAAGAAQNTPQPIKPAAPAGAIATPAAAPSSAALPTAAPQPTPRTDAPSPAGATATEAQAEPAQSTATPTSAIPALPEGDTTEQAQLHYGPHHDAFETLPAGARFTLLARDARGDWLRILWRKPGTSDSSVGWILAKQTNMDVRKSDDVPVPPRCARPAALLSASGASWTYREARRISAALVVDVFRETSGAPFPATAVRISINGASAKEIPVQATRGLLLLQRYTVSDLEIRPEDTVEIELLRAPDDQAPPQIFGMLFLVPASCRFQ